MWSPSSCYRRLIFCLQTSALHLHSLTGNTGLQLPFLPFHSFSRSLWCFFPPSSRPSVPDVFLNAKVGHGIQEGATTNKKASSPSSVIIKCWIYHSSRTCRPCFTSELFPSDSSRRTCRCSLSHLLAGAVEKWLPTSSTCREPEKTGPAGFQLDCSKDSELKVLLYADDTEVRRARIFVVNRTFQGWLHVTSSSSFMKLVFVTLNSLRN